MIALSSHRPFAKSEEWAKNQKLAWRTWQGYFRKVIYFGDEEPDLKSSQTAFLPSEQWPTIKRMAEVATSKPGVTAILNADILINPKLRIVENRLLNGSAVCASSRRWHFEVADLPSLDKARLVDSDRGRDIFIATHLVWQTVAREIPGNLRIGHQQWDAWMTDFFNRYKPAFIDFTQMRCIFHPTHGDRQMPFAEQVIQQPA